MTTIQDSKVDKSPGLSSGASSQEVQLSPILTKSHEEKGNTLPNLTRSHDTKVDRAPVLTDSQEAVTSVQTLPSAVGNEATYAAFHTQNSHCSIVSTDSVFEKPGSSKGENNKTVSSNNINVLT